MSGEYAGESLGKKVARVRTYLRAKQMLNAAGRREKLVALILPGPESSEAGCLRHILRPRVLVAVDRDQAAIDHLFAKTESFFEDDELCNMLTIGHTGELKGFKPLDLAVDFASLDLMTNLSGRPGEIIASTMEHMAVSGVVAVTYLRARETGDARETLQHVKGAVPFYLRHEPRLTKRILGADRGRALSLYADIKDGLFQHLLRSLRGRPGMDRIEGLNWDNPDEVALWALKMEHDFEQSFGVGLVPIASFSYQAEVSPMGVFMAQVMQGKPSKLYRKSLFATGSRRPTSDRRFLSSVLKRDPMKELLREADHLASMGFKPKQVADIFDVSVGTLAAWKAHRTMGTYAA